MSADRDASKAKARWAVTQPGRERGAKDVSTNGIVIPFGTRQEEDLSNEERAGYVVPEPTNTNPDALTYQSRSLWLDDDPHELDGVTYYLHVQANGARVWKPITPPPAVPLADQPAFAELMRINAAIIRAMQEERAADQHYQRCSREAAQANTLAAAAEERMVCASTAVGQLCAERDEVLAKLAAGPEAGS